MSAAQTVNILYRDSARIPGTRAALRWWRNSQGPGGKPLEAPPRGYVWILHGLGEHSGRYGELASFLTQFGFDVLAPDHPGHGLSRLEGGQEALVGLDVILEEAIDARSWWSQKGPLAARGAGEAPWLLIGHSMGALVTLGWLVRGKKSESEGDFALRALAIAPPLSLRLPVPAWKAWAAGWLRTSAPHLRMPNGISSGQLSRDAANRAAYDSDPLVHGDSSPANFLTMLEMAANVKSRAADVEIPLALAVGEDDPIVDPAAVREFYERVSTHKRFLSWPGMKHEILNEIGRREVYRAVAEWLF